MTRRLPIFSTLVVLAAVGTMVGLGVWQLHRADWKADLIARYQAALANPDPVPFPAGGGTVADESLYRRSSVICDSVGPDWNSIAGRNTQGEVGYVHIASCLFQGGTVAPVQIGWSRAPAHPDWAGGQAKGLIVPYGEDAVRLVADPPLAGLQASATPDPQDMPNNHMSYAVQWFFFALTALAIYALALRKRWRGELAQRGAAD